MEIETLAFLNCISNMIKDLDPFSNMDANEAEEYYALSTHFLSNFSNHPDYDPSSHFENINSQLFESDSPLSGKLK